MVLPFAILFCLVNFLAFLHARSFTTFAASAQRTASVESLGFLEKARLLFAGPTLPRPINTSTPATFEMPFETVRFRGALGTSIEAWAIPGTGRKIVVVMMHGYGGSKDSLLPVARSFRSMGSACLLVDAHGSGGSGGNTTSLGFHEAEDIAAAAREAKRRWPNHRRVLFGTSMGAAAALHAVAAWGVRPDAMILECPFDSLLTTVKHRFDLLGAPSFPAAHLLLFWGGWLRGFDAFSFKPAEDAESVRCPVLLMQGDQDRRVLVEEARNIERGLGSRGRLHVLRDVGHELYVEARPDEWKRLVREHLDALER